MIQKFKAKIRILKWHNLSASFRIFLWKRMQKFITKYRVELFIHEEMEKARNEHKIMVDNINKKWEIEYPGTSFIFNLFIQETIRLFDNSGAKNFLPFIAIMQDNQKKYSVIIQKEGGRSVVESRQILIEQLKKLGVEPEA